MSLAERNIAKKELEALTSLEESRGWELVKTALEVQRDNRFKMAQQPLSLEENPLTRIIAREAFLCEANGLQIALEMLSNLKDQFEFVLASTKEEVEDA